MGFLDSLLGMFGIGQPKVSLQIDRAQSGRGGLISGTVTVEGGRRPLPVTAFVAKLIREKKVKTEQGTSTERQTLREESAPQGGQVIEPGGSMRWSFVLQVPADTAPTGGDVTYKIEASLDCPGWDPSSEQALNVTTDIDSAAGEDLTEYFVLPERRSFRHSSVKGDYRVLLCDGGFVTTWKTEISVRNTDGSQRCRIPGWGKSIAVSPDGKRLVAADAQKRIGLFDLATGAAIGEPIHPGDWIFDVLWLADGTVLASATECIYLYDEAGQEKGRIAELDGASFYVGGIATSPRGFYVTDANGNRLLEADTSGKVLAKTSLRSPSSLFVGANGRLSVDCHDEVAVLDAGLGTVHRWAIPGKRGVRYAGQEQHSSNHFKGMPKLAADGQSVLVQDGSGQLWRAAAESGEPMRVWPRDVMDYVEDVAWMDDSHVLAVLNDGKVKKVAFDGTVKFEHQDVQ